MVEIGENLAAAICMIGIVLMFIVRMWPRHVTQVIEESKPSTREDVLLYAIKNAGFYRHEVTMKVLRVLGGESVGYSSELLELLEPSINPGVERLVGWLNEQGWQTVDSGDGETHDFACDREEPYVVILAQGQQDADGVLADLKGLLGDVPESVRIQYNYSPKDGFAFVDLTGLRDEMIDWGDA